MDKDFELIWYLNLTLSQILEVMDIEPDLAKSFVKTAQDAIAKARPDVLLVDERAAE